MRLTNPYSELTEEFLETSHKQLVSEFQNLQNHAQHWRNMPVAIRVTELGKVALLLAENQEDLAREISREMGKPICWSRIEIGRTVDEVKYTLNNAVNWLAPEPTPIDATPAQTEGYVRYDPLGSVAVIAPWNFPIMLPMRGIIPALICGNSVVFKPSELCLKTGARLVEMFRQVLSPCPLVGIFGGKELGASVVDLPVALIAFTGSTVTGKKIATASVSTLKRLIFELGGLDAALVLEDANLELAVQEIVLKNTQNSGQVCNAVKRVFVMRSMYEKLVAAVVKRYRNLRLGDPLDDSTEIGPIVSLSQIERLESFVEDAKTKGAQVMCGGKRAARQGFFFEPTVLVDVPSSAQLLAEEPFGPILPIIAVDSIEEGLQRVNETRFGLTASIFSNNIEQAKALAAKLDVGLVSINSHSAGGPGTPWGGVKESGFSRMKTKEGLREFCNVKFVKVPL